MSRGTRVVGDARTTVVHFEGMEASVSLFAWKHRLAASIRFFDGRNATAVEHETNPFR
jgi:hypothetical protein